MKDLSKEQSALLEKINNSDLEEDKKDLWFKIIPFLGDKEAGVIKISISRDKNTLEFLTKNIKDKMEVMSSGDEEKWNKISKEEDGFLDNI